MRVVTPSTFRTVKRCAEDFVAALLPPEDRDWLPFLRKEWRAIVGEALSAQTVPGKLWFTHTRSGKKGVLTVFVASQGAALVLHHETGFMRDAVNKYYKQDLMGTVRVQVAS